MNHDHETPSSPQVGGATDPKPLTRQPATVVYACSGCSDAGELADRIARQLSRDGAARMSCLAGIGGRVKSLVTTAEKAERILVVDGCPLNCARHTLRLAGFENFEHLELHKIGIRKGSCPVTEERIASGVQAAREILAGEPAAENGGEPQSESSPMLAAATLVGI
ncbi:MAG TPA: putative zinc-binding protein [Verrucomicrobiae bacterium]|nr:putative zinc-binding protein [Verrucomicrobiae bacterium]